jgi:aminotransferase
MSTDPRKWVAGHVAALPKSGIRDFFELVAKMKGQDVISLGVGEPDFVTPWHIREAAIFALEHGKTYYTSNLGLIELRRAISDYVTAHFGVNYSPDDQIIVTVGVSEALDIAFRAFCNPGDKVMFHQPCYVSYHPSISLVHGEAVPVPTTAADNFALTAAALRAAWVPGCRILMLNLPCNPTGGTCTREQLAEIAEFCREKDLLVLSDEIYSELTFDGTHTSIASLPGRADRTVFLHGFSKAFAMTGWRIGYACGPAPLVDAMMKVHQYSMMCASVIAQEAAIEALKNGAEPVERMREHYHRRRDIIKENISALYEFMLKENYSLESLDFSVDRQNIILGTIVYSADLNEETGKSILGDLFKKADYYDHLLAEKFGMELAEN